MKFKLLFIFMMVTQFTFSLDTDFYEYLKPYTGKKINVAIVGLNKPKYFEDRTLGYNSATNESIFKTGILKMVSESFIVINSGGLEIIIPFDKIGYISFRDKT